MPRVVSVKGVARHCNIDKIMRLNIKTIKETKSNFLIYLPSKVSYPI